MFAFPFQKEELGRCIGPIRNGGNNMWQWVLQKNGQVALRRNLRRLRLEELTVTKETESNKHAPFNADIKELLVDYIVFAPLKQESECFDPTFFLNMMKMMNRPLQIFSLRLILLIKLVNPLIISVLLI